MKSEDSAVVRTYSNEIDADLAASWLDAENVPYELISDDAGGALPNLQVTRGVKLVVRREDEERANEILDRGEEEIDPSVLADDSSAGPDTDPDNVPTREIRREDDAE